MYGLLANLQEGFTINNVVFVLSAVIFSSFIFVSCNIAQYVTEEVGIFLVVVGVFQVVVLSAQIMQLRIGDEDGNNVGDYERSWNFVETGNSLCSSSTIIFA